MAADPFTGEMDYGGGVAPPQPPGTLPPPEGGGIGLAPTALVYAGIRTIGSPKFAFKGSVSAPFGMGAILRGGGAISGAAGGFMYTGSPIGAVLGAVAAKTGGITEAPYLRDMPVMQTLGGKGSKPIMYTPTSAEPFLAGKVPYPGSRFAGIAQHDVARTERMLKIHKRASAKVEALTRHKKYGTKINVYRTLDEMMLDETTFRPGMIERGTGGKFRLAKNYRNIPIHMSELEGAEGIVKELTPKIRARMPKYRLKKLFGEASLDFGGVTTRKEAVQKAYSAQMRLSSRVSRATRAAAPTFEATRSTSWYMTPGMPGERGFNLWRPYERLDFRAVPPPKTATSALRYLKRQQKYVNKVAVEAGADLFTASTFGATQMESNWFGKYGGYDPGEIKKYKEILALDRAAKYKGQRGPISAIRKFLDKPTAREAARAASVARLNIATKPMVKGNIKMLRKIGEEYGIHVPGGKMAPGAINKIRQEISEAVVDKAGVVGGAAKAAKFAGTALGVSIGYDLAKLAVQGGMAVTRSIEEFTGTLRSLEFGGPGMAVATTGATTERQRALQALQNSTMNARQYIGREANLLHNS